MSEQANGLIDIVEPAMPVAAAAGSWLGILIVVCVLLLLLIAAGYWLKYKLPAWRALKRLRALHKQLQAGEHTPHESVLLLALELRHGLGVKRLLADKAPPQIKAKDHARWPLFMQELDVLLYQKEKDLNAAQVAAFFMQSEYWLKRYGKKSSFRKMEF